MKNNTLSQALDLIVTNLNVKNSNIKAFEWTRIYNPDQLAVNGLCDEKHVFWLIGCGEINEQNWKQNDAMLDVFYLKGILNNIFDALDLPITIQQHRDSINIPYIGTYLHPTRSGIILYKEVEVGVIGEIHPQILKNYGIKNARPCFAQLNQEVLHLRSDSRKYVAPTNLQPIIRDVCLILPVNLQSKSVIDYMVSGSSWLSEVSIVDVFNDQDITGGLNAVTFSLNYSLENIGKTSVTTEEINMETDRVVQLLVNDFERQHYKIIKRS